MELKEAFDQFKPKSELIEREIDGKKIYMLMDSNYNTVGWFEKDIKKIIIESIYISIQLINGNYIYIYKNSYSATL